MEGQVRRIVASLLLQMNALRLTLAAYVISIKRLSVVFAVILGGTLLREAQLNERLLGAAVMVAGVAQFLHVDSPSLVLRENSIFQNQQFSGGLPTHLPKKEWNMRKPQTKDPSSKVDWSKVNGDQGFEILNALRLKDEQKLNQLLETLPQKKEPPESTE